jgi:hypothetical protein
MRFVDAKSLTERLHGQLSFFAEEQDRKYQAASSGSDLENVYAQARNAAYVAFQNQLQKEVLNRSAEIGAN